MTVTTVSPRIYVACLAAYNNGKLHGKWIDAAQDVDDIWAEIKEMLKASPEPGAEEWAVHDYEGFSPWRLSEWPSIEKVAMVAELVEDKGEAVLHWLANDETPLDDATDLHDLEEAFDEAFAGEWESTRAYVYEFIDDVGLPGIGHGATIPSGPFTEKQVNIADELSGYLDWDALEEWVFDGSLWATDPVAPNYNVFVFRSL